MNWQASSFDWNQARAFLATAEAGSLSAAARRLGLTQPTLSRQVAALEAALSVVLFDRVGRALTITPAGLDLLEHFKAMGAAATTISLAASGQSQVIDGQVSITASDAVAAHILPPVLKKLQALAPGLEVEVQADNGLRDLRRREADIAIRHARPDQPDLIAKLAHSSVAHMFASPAYLDSIGRPKTLADLAQANFIGFAPIARLISTLSAFGLPLTRQNFSLVTDNGIVVGEMMKAGLGIGIMPADFAKFLPEVEAVLPEAFKIPVPFWLVTHRELHTSRRIRLVFDVLSDALGPG